MLNKKTFKTIFRDKPVILEVSRLAEQANAAVFGYYGQTVVMATVVMDKTESDKDYLPLTVEFEEKFYAAGKILGSRFVRREGRAPESAVLSARMIDRTIRPLFNHRLRRDIQVVVTVLSLDDDDETYAPVFIGLLAVSAAIAISDIPWAGPVAGVNINKGWKAFVAGTPDKISMIELEGLDAAEKEVIKEFETSQKEITALIKFQKEIVGEIGKTKTAVNLNEPDSQLRAKISKFLSGKLEAALYVKNKTERLGNLDEVREQLFAFLREDNYGEKDLTEAQHLFEEEIDALVHKNILEKEQRPDGRKLDEVRELYSEVGVFERLHGSAIFIRGNTQSLGVTTLAPPDSHLLVETIGYSGPKHFLLHYNFPPYSTGETGSFRGPGRREIGHGALAEKALKNLIPTKEEFPYTIRVVSEILSSNGSSSMASVCAGCLSLMDAGVPIKKMAAGIAMGLMSGEGKYKILTDIQGPEDHYGDMDFKVAGTKDGVTAIQMDVKIDGVTTKILEEVLAQAKKARLEIIAAMEKTLAQPRPEISKYAPVVITLMIDPEKIGGVIGGGGKTINGIIAQTGIINMDIEDDGRIYIYSNDKESAEKARAQVEAIVKEYKVGDIVEGTVVKILEFGAIVEFGPKQDGMIHISELKEGYVKKVEEVLKLGDFVRAKVIRSENGKIGLSLRGLTK